MKTIKRFILFFWVMGIVHVNLFSLITSRVEGIVVDEETGSPINNALVSLYTCKSDVDREYYTEKSVFGSNNRVQTDDTHFPDNVLSIQKQ